METKFKKGDIVYWQQLQGVVINIDSIKPYPITVNFNTNTDNYDDFTIDGRFINYAPPVLSHTPYTLNGFTQNSVIEKDTIVWVRNFISCDWIQRFYSHFENGKHYCFENQKTSKETYNTFSWNYLETENPLLKKINP